MKDDNMQNLNNTGRSENPLQQDDKSFFDKVSKNSDAQIEKILEETMAQSRKDKVKNFAVHIDDVSDALTDIPEPAKHEPEKSKDIFSFSDHTQAHTQTPPPEPTPAAPRRNVSENHRDGVDISAPPVRRKPEQTRPAFDEEEYEEEAEPTKWPGKKALTKKAAAA